MTGGWNLFTVVSRCDFSWKDKDLPGFLRCFFPRLRGDLEGECSLFVRSGVGSRFAHTPGRPLEGFKASSLGGQGFTGGMDGVCWRQGGSLHGTERVGTPGRAGGRRDVGHAGFLRPTGNRVVKAVVEGAALGLLIFDLFSLSRGPAGGGIPETG